MNNKLDLTFVDLLKSICCKIGNTWHFNNVKTTSSFLGEMSFYSDKNRYYLNNNDNVFISIAKIKGLSIVKIGYFDEKYNSFISDASINLNFSKSFNRIVSDIENRILLHTNDVKIKIKSKKEEYKKKSEQQYMNDLIIYSIKKVINKTTQFYLSSSRNGYCFDHKITCSERVKKLLKKDFNYVTRANLIQLDSNDKFNFNLYDLTPEEVIKVIVALKL